MSHLNPSKEASAGGVPASPAAPGGWNERSTLASIALQGHVLAAVLSRHHLDFCCGGQRQLQDACAARSIEVASVLADLEVARQQLLAEPTPIIWDAASATEIVRHVVDTHHAYTRAAFARIDPLLKKVVAKHGAAHPELVTAKALFKVLAADLETHLAKEERILFPYILSLDGSPSPARPPFQTVANPVRMMRHEHDDAAGVLADLANATNGFEPPLDACISFTTLYAALADLRTDLFIHISLENNVLFPKALELEGERWSGASDTSA